MFQTGLGEFLHRHGHRAAQEIEIATPRWHDDPAPLIASVAGFARAADTGHSAVEHYREQSAKAEQALAGAAMTTRKAASTDAGSNRAMPAAAWPALTHPDVLISSPLPRRLHCSVR